MGDEVAFQDEWVHEERFQGWLVKVSNDERRAYCRVCSVVLQAKKAELSVHSRTQLHLANTKLAHENGGVAGPISVQIVCNEEDEEEFTQPVGEEEVEDDGEFKHEVTMVTPTIPRSSTRSRGSGGSSGKRYMKKYRPAWEEEPEFKNWLQAYPEDIQRAFCKACTAILRAHKHDLSCHARTARHLKKMQDMYGEEEVTIISPDNDLHSKRGLDDSSSHIEEIGIEIDTSAIFPDNGNGTSVEVENEDRRQKIVRLPKMNRLQIETPKALFFSRKRPRLTVSDVICAIDNDEFTGYELLQIVKKAVPKL